MSAFLVTIRDGRAKREAARQYVMAADRWREMAAAKRRLGRPVGRRDEIANALIRCAAFELTT